MMHDAYFVSMLELKRKVVAIKKIQLDVRTKRVGSSGSRQERHVDYWRTHVQSLICMNIVSRFLGKDLSQCVVLHHATVIVRRQTPQCSQ